MFTGIVAGIFPVATVTEIDGITQFSVELPEDHQVGLEIGASVSIDGVCLTVVRMQDGLVYFDAVKETLFRSTLKALAPGRQVNVERAAKFGDEIGGHFLSGHVLGTASIANIENDGSNRVITFECPRQWMKYILTKGYIALDGASLTVVDADRSGSFSVTLIPETLRKTTFGYKGLGDLVNLEIDPHTQMIVESVERVLLSNKVEQRAI